MALWEGLWEGLWKTSENLWKPLKTSENLWKPLKTSKNLWKALKSSETIPLRGPLRDPLRGRFPSQNLSGLLPLIVLPLKTPPISLRYPPLRLFRLEGTNYMGRVSAKFCGFLWKSWRVRAPWGFAWHNLLLFDESIRCRIDALSKCCSGFEGLQSHIPFQKNTHAIVRAATLQKCGVNIFSVFSAKSVVKFGVKFWRSFARATLSRVWVSEAEKFTKSSRQNHEDVNGEKLTVTKWWIFGADFHGLRRVFHGL